MNTYQSNVRYLTVEEIATRWNVCVETVRREYRAGRLKGMKVGKDIRVRDSAVRAYEEENGN